MIQTLAMDYWFSMIQELVFVFVYLHSANENLAGIARSPRTNGLSLHPL